VTIRGEIDMSSLEDLTQRFASLPDRFSSISLRSSSSTAPAFPSSSPSGAADTATSPSGSSTSPAVDRLLAFAGVKFNVASPPAEPQLAHDDKPAIPDRASRHHRSKIAHMPSESRSSVQARRFAAASAIGRGLLLIVVAPLIGPGGYNVFGQPRLEEADLAID
jgi:hypothetical protein